ncbi:uncharacterized protein LOC130968771 [Arachis stenosperma]|uniref:uncharacterized protein LOC130968771 n=1 Tax=Arachis stenosperma TaxID=217475 RepID=UPI0025AB9FA9|nr:uncharacterized protein LOC130968771 [Arachis stenosperma]
MDSISNIPLLEITAEDDSLLLDASTAGGDSAVSSAAAASTVFSCSPLISVRSLPRTNGRVGDVNSENASAATKKDSKNNKENVIWNNKPEAAKLSMEPQQMKRKKKEGGYNLRKSLAWNRAFFEEEGVLNPLELSMISGTATPKRPNTVLKAINEEEPASASIALKEIEDNLFKQSSEGVVCTENRSVGAAAFLSPKSGASTKVKAFASVAKRKVLANNDTVVNRPKRNVCLRPAASSSLKRPEPVKATNRESKATNIDPKSNAPVVTNTPRRGTLSTSLPKRNHNAHPATNIQKYAGAKGLSKNPRIVPLPNKPKVDQADKCSISRTVNKEARKHLDSSISEKSVPSGQHQSGSRGPNVSEACVPQVILETNEKKQVREFQTTKPSGLRMPSPSLGFFSQAKPSNSHSQLQKSSIPCKPEENNFPKLRKLERHCMDEARLPQVSSKGSDTVENTINNCTEKFSLPDVRSEASTEVNSNRLTASVVESHSFGPGKISEQEMVENKQNYMNAELHFDLKSKEQAELHKSEGVSNMEDMEFPRHEKKLLSKSSHSHEQLEKEVDLPLEDKLHDVLSCASQLVVQEPEPIIHHSMHRTLIKRDNISNTMPDAVVQDEEQVTSNVLTSNESFLLQQKDTKTSNDTRHSGEFKEHNCVKTAEANGNAVGYHKQGDAAQVDVLNGNPLANCSVSTPSILGVVNRQLEGEQISIPNHSIIGEISSEIENESQRNTSEVICVITVSSKHPLEKSVPEIRVGCESQPKVVESEGRQHSLNDQSGSIPGSVDEASHQIVDSKAMDNSTQPIELDRMCDDCIAVSSVCDGEVKHVSPGSRTICENNTENIHFVKADCDSRANDMLINDYCNMSEWQLSDDDSSMDTSMSYDDQYDVSGNFEQHANIRPEWQLGDDGSSRHTSTQLDDHHDVPGNFERRADSRSDSETNKMVCEDESLVKTDGHLLDENEVCGVTKDFISNTKNSICSGSENPSRFLQLIVPAQSVTELDHTMSKSEKSLAKDVQPLNFAENPEVYNCNSEQCLSVANDQLPSVGDIDNNEKSHLSELQGTTVVYADSQHVNNIMHLEGDGETTNTAYSEEIKNQNLFEGASKGSIISTSESNYSNHHTQPMPEYKDGNLEADDSLECLQMGNMKVCSTDILPTEVQFNDQVVSAEFDSFIKSSEDITEEVVTCQSDVHCSSSENSKLPASDNEPFRTRIPQGSEVSSQEAKNNILEDHEFTNIDTQNQTTGGLHLAEESSKITHHEKSATKSKPEVPSVKIPPNVAPFSDEWLAAIEAAGEEILTMKGGAVQNSPPEKPQHEPSPWSPVRKHQAIGPYDCTKHTNIPHSDSS